MKSRVVVTMLSSLFCLSALAKDPVIYGDDNRLEVYEASPVLQELARSTAVLVPSANILPHPEKEGLLQLEQKSFRTALEESLSREEGKRKLKLKSSNEAITFCPEERFVEQPNPGACSGFLIAPDLIVTAGHCVKIDKFCEDHKWVFDFKLDRRSKSAGLEVSPENIFSCKRVVSGGLAMLLGLDYGLVQLERKVKGRSPLELQTTEMPQAGTEIVVVGNPSGLPTKVAGGATIRSALHPFYFLTTLDTYQGNSGSPVFNVQTGLVEGILVRGEDDFVANTARMCIESKRCLTGECRGEAVSRMTSMPEIAFMRPLHEAAATGDSATIEKLMKLNFWIDIYGPNGVTALMRAAKHPVMEILGGLIARGADLTLSDKDGQTPLHYLAVNLSVKNAEALDLFLKAGAPLEARNERGETPILTAARWLNLAAIKLLIDAGADKNAVNAAGESILTPFLNMGDGTSVEELLALGVGTVEPEKSPLPTNPVIH